MDCRSCDRRPECREICPALEADLKQYTRYARETLVDPSYIGRVAESSIRTWADILPDYGWLWDRLISALPALSTRELQPFLLHYHEGKSVIEIARRLRLHRSTVNRRLTRAAAILKQEIARRGPGARDEF